MFFQICFTYECIIKIFALGLVGHRLSYLRDPWNTFDFIILVSGCVALRSLINLTYQGAKDALLALESTSLAINQRHQSALPYSQPILTPPDLRVISSLGADGSH